MSQPSQPRTVVNPAGLPAPTGAPDTPFYSWVVTRGPYIALAGMVPYDAGKRLVGDDLATQARQAFANLRTALEAVGATVDDVVSITVHVSATDLQKDVFPAINAAGFETFGPRPPARTTVGGVTMPRPTELIQVSAIAIRLPADA